MDSLCAGYCGERPFEEVVAGEACCHEGDGCGEGIQVCGDPLQAWRSC